MKLLCLLSFSLTARLVAGHAYVWGVTVNGKEIGRGDAVPGYVRKVYGNNPITDVRSPDMTCNKNQGVNNQVVPVQAGDTVSVIWAHGTRGDEVIADSHKGPVQIYMAPAAGGGKGDVWVKLASRGFDNGRWATDELRANKGQHSITIPNLVPGDYLIRPEIVALHSAGSVGGAQIYMACVQIKVSGSGTKNLPKGIAFPGAYSPTDPGILYNVYDKPLKRYIAPGGPVITV